MSIVKRHSMIVQVRLRTARHEAASAGDQQLDAAIFRQLQAMLRAHNTYL
jgi:hypothetical protein